MVAAVPQSDDKPLALKPKHEPEPLKRVQEMSDLNGEEYITDYYSEQAYPGEGLSPDSESQHQPRSVGHGTHDEEEMQ